MDRKAVFPQPEVYNIYSGIYNLPEARTFSGYKTGKIVQAAELILGSYTEKRKDDTASVIHLDLVDIYHSETYTITIDAAGIKISASGEAGFINGLLTIKQLILNYNRKLPYISITDSPLFAWRGVMIDVCRHFHGPLELKRLIPILATFKINRLHLHLTEDQGWRLESRKYPKLTEIGSVREKTMASYSNPRTYRDSPHGGYLTREDLKELIDLADIYNIIVVPEIEMPGHSLAALASYPELGCGGDYKVSPDFGIFKDVLCLGNDRTLQFCKDIISETAEIFPSEYIHIGGDEVPTDRWEDCDKCGMRKEELGLETFRDLQFWFNEEIRKHAESLGKKIICWNEAIAPETNSEICIQYWRGDYRKFSDFLERGGKGIISDYDTLYFDHSHRFSSLNDVYKTAARYKKDIPGGNILGFEAPLWTEWIPNRERLDHQLFPRLAALAEVCWHGGCIRAGVSGKDARKIGRENRKHFLSAKTLQELYVLFKKLAVFPASLQTATPFVPFKKAARLKELQRQWDTQEYRKMPVAGVPNDLDTRIS